MENTSDEKCSCGSSQTETGVKKPIVASCLPTRQYSKYYFTEKTDQIMLCRKKIIATALENIKQYANTATLFGINAEFLLLQLAVF